VISKVYIFQWRKTLIRHPRLKPCLHRSDDGMAHRVDRSGAAGHGVCSLAAAFAFRTLKAEL